MPEKTTKKKSWNMTIGSVSNTDIMLFTKHLSIAIKAGMTLVEGLEMLHEQATAKFKEIIGIMLEQVRTGRMFSDALSQYPRYFPSIYVNLVKTGEIAGTLEGNLHMLAENLRKTYDLKKKVHSALMYPALIFTALIGLGLSIAIFVLPKILPLFKTLKVDLPITTRALIFMAGLFTEHTFSIVGGLVFAIIFFTWLLRQNFTKPVTHRLFLIIPVVKTIVKNINLTRFSRTLTTLISSGIEVDRALVITADAMSNRIYQHAIESIIPEVQKGKGLGETLALYPQLFPKMASRMVMMGERTGSMDTTLQYISEFYESEVDSSLNNLSSILEPFLLIFIGVSVGVMALSILGPIYKITGSLRG